MSRFRETQGSGVEPTISVIVTVGERPDDLYQLYCENAAALEASGRSYEFIYVLEPYNEALGRRLLEARKPGEPIRVVQMGQPTGEAALLRSGASLARGEVLVTLPGYWRVEASGIPPLIDRLGEGADLVVARRWPRTDSWLNRLQNRLFNGLVRAASNTKVNDLACGVRAIRPDVLEEVPLYGDFLRFYPLLVAQSGFRVEEVEAKQHPQDDKTRVYAPGVYVRRLLDLLAVFFLLRFTDKPLRFFGLLGGTVSMVGGAILAVLLVQRLQGIALADRPLMVVGVLLLALGVQAIALGLIGEILVFLHAPTRRPYRLKRDDDGFRSTVDSGQRGQDAVTAAR